MSRIESLVIIKRAPQMTDVGVCGAKPPAAGGIGGLGAERLALGDFYKFLMKLTAF